MEMLVATALISVLTLAAAGAIQMILRVSDQAKDQTVVLRQVQNAGDWVSKDVSTAKPGTVSVNAQGLPSMQAYAWDGANFTEHTVEYAFSANALYRKVDGTAPGILIAQYIDTQATQFSLQGSVYKFNVQVTYDGRTYSGAYESKAGY